MATIPRHVIQTQINTGSSPAQMNVISLSGHRAISAPQFIPRMVEAPYYEAPVNKVGPVVSNKALQQFGNTLLDVTMSMADRRARLFADEYGRQQQREIDKVLVDDPDAYILTEQLEAISREGEIKSKLNEIEKNTLEKAPNHVKLYLNSMAKDNTNRALRKVAEHIVLQTKKAEQTSTLLKLNTIAKNANDAEDQPVSKIAKMIKTEVGKLPAKSEYEYIQFENAVYDNVISHKLRQTFLDIEKRDTVELNASFEYFSKYAKQLREFSSPEEGNRIDTMIIAANSELVTEMNRRRVVENRIREEHKLAAMNMIAADFNNGKAFPTRTARSLVVMGDMTEVDYKQAEGWWSSNNATKQSDPSVYYKYHKYINDRIDPNEWTGELLSDAANGYLTMAHYTKFLDKATGVYGEDFDRYLKRLTDMLESRIITTLGGAEYRVPGEREMFVDAVKNGEEALLALRRKNMLNDESYQQIYKMYDIEFGFNKQIKRWGQFPTTPENYPKVVQNADDLAKIVSYYTEQYKAKKIDEETFTAMSRRFMKLKTLIFRRDQEMFELKNSSK